MSDYNEGAIYDDGYRDGYERALEECEAEKMEMVQEMLGVIDEHKVIDGLSFEGDIPPAEIFTEMMEDTNMIRVNVNGVLDVLKEAIAAKYITREASE